jgi:hypothetical protein
MARGQGDLKLARPGHGVVVEEFVEVAESEEEERAGVLPLQLLILLKHGRQWCRIRLHLIAVA